MPVNNQNNWDEKFYREQPFMAFGSMMNAYGKVNEGQGKSREDFEEDAKKIFQTALKYTYAAYNFSKADNEKKKTYWK